MAKLNNSIAAFLVVILSFLFIITIAETRTVFRMGISSPEQLSCDTVFGVRSGDTCFEIAQNFQLTTPEFDAINPNLNCSALFVGQWLCVDGSS